MRHVHFVFGALLLLAGGMVTLAVVNAQNPDRTLTAGGPPPANPITAVGPGAVPISPAVHACMAATVSTTLIVDKTTLGLGPGQHHTDTPVAAIPQQVHQDFGSECTATFTVAHGPEVAEFDPTTACTFEIVTTKGTHGVSADVKEIGDCAGVALQSTMSLPPPR